VKRVVLSTGLLLLMQFSIAWAQPHIQSIDGEFVDGQEVTINGSLFGEKNPAAPLVWDNFESGTHGALLSTDPKWVGYNGRPGGLYANFAAYSGTLAAFNRNCGPNAAWPDSSRLGFDTNNYFHDPTDEVYYSYQWMWRVANPDANNSGVLKAGRSLADGQTYDGTGRAMISGMNPETGRGMQAIFTSNGDLYTDENTPDQAPGQWYRHEIYKLNSTPGVADGKISFAIECNEFWRDEAIETRGAGENFHQTAIILGLMPANVGNYEPNDGDVSVFVDDVYLDVTRARVEVGDNPVWANCTHRDPQIPVAWQNGQIRVTVNQGGFADAATVYVFVVDRQGQPSNGVEGTFGERGGGGGDLGPPGPCSPPVLTQE